MSLFLFEHSIYMYILLFYFINIGVIKPGDPALDSSLVRTGTDSLVVLIHQNDQLATVGMMVISTQEDDAEIITRTERLVGLNGSVASIDSFALSARTLAPTSGSIAGREMIMTGEAFHPNSIDIVLAALPLTVGYSADLSLETGGADLPPIARVNVQGVEDVTLPSGEVCYSWMVRVSIDDKRGIYFIDQISRKVTRYVSLSDRIMMNRIRGCGS